MAGMVAKHTGQDGSSLGYIVAERLLNLGWSDQHVVELLTNEAWPLVQHLFRPDGSRGGRKSQEEREAWVRDYLASARP